MDNTEQILYSNFIKAQKEWVNYIRPVATKSFNDRLNELNKKYYRYQYYSTIRTTDNVVGNTEIKQLYRKLSLKFHPDKFQKNGYIFVLLTKMYETGDQKSLEYINELSHHIMECENLDSILKIISDKEELKKLVDFMKTNDNILNYVD